MATKFKAVTITDAAAERVRAILAKRIERGEPPAVGLRIGVRTKGCSGLSYDIQYADSKGPHDEVIEDKGVTILIDPKAQMFLFGSEIDWAENTLQNGFVFRNPNEKGRCGCGESFHV
jgi:iron-sulfur cluster assembly protein